MTCLQNSSVGVLSWSNGGRRSPESSRRTSSASCSVDYFGCPPSHQLERFSKGGNRCRGGAWNGNGRGLRRVEEARGICGLQSYIFVRAFAIKAFCQKRAEIEESTGSKDTDREDARSALALFLQKRSEVERLESERIASMAPYYIDNLIARVKEHSSLNGGGETGAFFQECLSFLTKSRFLGVEPYLESIGVPVERIAMVAKYSRWGLSPESGVVAKINFLLGIGLEAADIGKIVHRYPRILSTSIAYLQLKMAYLRRLGLTHEEVLRLVKSTPQCLGFSLKETAEPPVVEYLKSLGVRNIGKVISRTPQLLTLNLENNVKNAIAYLFRIGVKGDRLARLIETHPSVLCRRVEHKVEFLKSLGFTIESGTVARVILQCPTMSIESIKLRIEFMMSVGLSHSEVLGMVSKSPSFLSKSIEKTLAPRVAYLTKEMGLSVHELVKAPNFLSSSMEGRIKPRHRVLSELLRLGCVDREYSLSTIISWTDDTFYEKFVETAPDSVKALWVEPKDETIGLSVEEAHSLSLKKAGRRKMKSMLNANYEENCIPGS